MAVFPAPLSSAALSPPPVSSLRLKRGPEKKKECRGSESLCKRKQSKTHLILQPDTAHPVRQRFPFALRRRCWHTRGHGYRTAQYDGFCPHERGGRGLVVGLGSEVGQWPQ